MKTRSQRKQKGRSPPPSRSPSPQPKNKRRQKVPSPPPSRSPSPQKNKKKQQQQHKEYAELDALRRQAQSKDKHFHRKADLLEDTLKAIPVDKDEVEDQLYMLEDANRKAIESLENLEKLALKLDDPLDEVYDVQEGIDNIQDRLCKLRREARSHIKESKEEEKTSHKKIEEIMKMPEIQLPKFGGDVRDWLGFWAQFKDIHEKKNVTKTQKYKYLLQCLVPDSEAHKVATSFTFSGENYEAALGALKERFGRESMLIKVYMRDLLRNTYDKKVKFTDLVTTLTSQIRSLEVLGITVDKCENCSHIIYPVVESCLSEETLKTWQNSSGFQETVEDLIKFLNREVNKKKERDLAKTESTSTEKKTEQKTKKAPKKEEVATASGFLNSSNAADTKNKGVCIFCDGKHPSKECRRGVNLPYEERSKKVQASGKCFKCFEGGHLKKQCQDNPKCSNCEMVGHYAIMCWKPSKKQSVNNQAGAGWNSRQTFNPYQQNAGAQPQNQQGQQFVQYVPSAPASSFYGQHAAAATQPPSQHQNTVSTGMNQECSLANQGGTQECHETFLVKAWGPRGTKIIRAAIDGGSSKSYILDEVTAELGHPELQSIEVEHELFGGRRVLSKHKRYRVTLSDPNGNGYLQHVLYSVPTIANAMKKPIPGEWSDRLKQQGIHLTGLEAESEKIELLIGIDLNPRISTTNMIKLSDEFMVRQTLWGWVPQGKVPCDQSSSGLVTNLLFQDLNENDLWSLDQIGIRDDGQQQTKEELEQIVLEQFQKDIKRLPDGRYEVKLPWIEPKQKLKSNRAKAYKRLKKTTEELKMNGYLADYNAVFEDWKQKGIIEEVPDDCDDSSEYFLPHRAVVKKKSATTPVRPVFNASSKSGFGGPSLNECLHTGPNLLELIPDIMLRFRKKRFGVYSDIEKAFLMISVAEEDRKYLKFLWWDETMQRVVVYRHKRVVFGIKSSPFLLAATLQYHIMKYGDIEIQEILLKSFYVDNCVTSFDTIEEAHKFMEESVRLLSLAQFNLRDWHFGNNGEDEKIAVLGMEWDTKNDTLAVSDSVVSIELHMEKEVTKRSMLSEAHSVFDPLGFFGPFTIIPKMLLQECWEANNNWDEEVAEDVKMNFLKWRKQVPELEDIKIPRWLTSNSLEDVWDTMSLHVFCDASKDGYATAIFMRTVEGGEPCIRLVTAKPRVSPKKKLTIPRLELLSCLIGATLANTVKKVLDIPEEKVWYWSDSTTALTWIKTDKPWKTFVANRVKTIRSFSNTLNWNHVAGEKNPADLPSRGCTVEKLKTSRWWEGPDWLKGKEETWYAEQPLPNEDEVSTELRKTVSSGLNVQSENILDNLSKYGVYEKILRILAIAQIFGKKSVSNITAQNINDVEMIVIKHIQKKIGENNKWIKKLKVFKDDAGILRLKSPIYFGSDPYDTRCPIILPGDDEVVKLLIRSYHYRHAHGGVAITLQAIRERFWIMDGRRSVRKVVNTCAVCRPFTAKKILVESIPLPPERVDDQGVFGCVGVDLAGPLVLKGGQKVWIVLYTCAVYRAVHLEIAVNLSTEAFMKTFRRFVGRRGRPKIVYSDNGTNFVGANNLFRKINWSEVQRHASVNRIDWRFNPPTAAWWGGWWERLIGSMKQLLRRVLGNRVVTHEELLTLTVEVESAVNSRPLGYVSDSPEEVSVLTPNHFLRDNLPQGLPEADVVDAKLLSDRAKLVQKMRDELKSRFRMQYLGFLRQSIRSKNTPIGVGDVVLVENDNKKRIDWPVGVVTDIHSSKDGAKRLVTVKTKSGKALRPVQRLYLLEAASDTSEDYSYEEDFDKTVDVLSPPADNVVRTRSGRVVKPVKRYS